jgi:hypothetical protein
MVVAGPGRAASARTIGLAVALVGAVCAHAADAALEELEARWDFYMLAGLAGVYRDGAFKAAPPGPSPDSRAGYVCDSGHGAAISAVGPRWTVGGGLIRRVETGVGNVALYGRCTWRRGRIPPIPLFHYQFGGTSTLEGYAVMLVERPSGADRGRLLRQWAFQANEHSAAVAENRDAVRAELSLDPSRHAVSVTVHGLKTPFQELVDLR